MIKRFFSNVGYNCIKSWYDFMTGTTKEKPTGWSIDFIESCDVKILAGILEKEFEIRQLK